MKMICPKCRYIGESEVISKGSRTTEIALWCCLFLPGLLYTMWRKSSDGQYVGCPQCHTSEIRPMKKKEWKLYERTGQLPA